MRVTGPGRTRDGHPVPLLANIGGPADLGAAIEHGAEGVGLYRTEFLFLDRDVPPTAREQEDAYRAALEAFPGGRVVVRTLDAGADKPLAFLPPVGGQPNPALGERGLRLFRRHPEVMAAQLDALVGSSGSPRVDAAAHDRRQVDGLARWRGRVGACEHEERVNQTGQAVRLGDGSVELRPGRLGNIGAERLESEPQRSERRPKLMRRVRDKPLLRLDELTELHGGKIWCHPECKAGCDMRFTLPIAPVDAQVLKNAEASESSRLGGTP